VGLGAAEYIDLHRIEGADATLFMMERPFVHERGVDFW
jgi:hypothetical protein